jgi:MFS family permease
MMITLGVYILATVLTAFATTPLYFFAFRFLTGSGIGGEYAAINSAIDELIPARNRGQVDLTINGSYWVGAALGGIAALGFLDTAVFARDFGWRLSFAVGALIGLAILLVRRSVPESPRWLFIHGRDEEAERIVDQIEAGVRDETDRQLAEPGAAITVRQRKSIPFREIARVAWNRYPKRVVLGLSLFVGQAFIYNAVTFNLGTMLNKFYGVASGTVPAFIVIFAIGNFLGPLLLGRFFDTAGRKRMISGTYLVSAGLTVILAILLIQGGLTQWSFIALVGITFFFASAGASSAYLTVSEIFPMETRALAIAFFYAIGTGAGGIIGPLLFGNLIDSGPKTVAIGFFIGAVVMAIGGIAELLFGVRAERTPLEDIATPITVVDAEPARPARPGPGPGRGTAFYSPGMVGTASHWTPAPREDLDREVDEIARALDEHGRTDRDDLAAFVGARYWGPGRFRAALTEAVDDGRARRLPHNTYAPAESSHAVSGATGGDK